MIYFKIITTVFFQTFLFSCHSQQCYSSIKVNVDSSKLECIDGTKKDSLHILFKGKRECYTTLVIQNPKRIKLTVSKRDFDIFTEIESWQQGKYQYDSNVDGVSGPLITGDPESFKKTRDSVLTRRVSFPPSILFYEKGDYRLKYIFKFYIGKRFYTCSTDWYYFKTD